MGIKKIALLAGVSIGTVDRALHGRGRVSPETQKKILKIAKKIDYKPNIAARSLKKNSPLVIALVVPEYKSDDYWKQSRLGMEAALKKWQAFGVKLTPYYYKLSAAGSFSTSARKALALKPDGIIFAPVFYQEGLTLLRQCADSNIPALVFNTHLPEYSPQCFIGTDSVQSGRLAAELMHMSAGDLGKIAIIHFDEEFSNSPHMLEKEQGFKSYFTTLKPGRQEIVSYFADSKKKTLAKQLAAVFQDDRLTGVFVSTSKVFIVGEYIRRHKIPGLIIIGYDLIDKNAALIKQGAIQFLINQNPFKQTELAVSSFCETFILKRPLPSTILLPLEIITAQNLVSYQPAS